MAVHEQKAGRLAFRQEGEYWNAYFAEPNTMHGALHLGSIRIRFVSPGMKNHEEIKAAFMNVMMDAMGAMLENVVGPVTWPDPPEPAPESERSGNA